MQKNKNKIKRRATRPTTNVSKQLGAGSIKWQYDAITKEEGLLPGTLQNMRWDIETVELKSAKKAERLLNTLGDCLERGYEYSVKMSLNKLNGGYLVHLYISGYPFNLKEILSFSKQIIKIAETVRAVLVWWHVEISASTTPEEAVYLTDIDQEIIRAPFLFIEEILKVDLTDNNIIKKRNTNYVR